MRPPSDLPRAGGLDRYGRRVRNVLLVAVVVAVVGVVVLRWMARLVTDSWWFDSVEQRDVLSTISLARVELGVVAGLTAACLLYTCLLVVDRTGAIERPRGNDDPLVLRYQVLMGEHGLAVRVIASVAFGVVAALPATARWQDWLLFRHGVAFRVADEVYHRDVAFYAFKLPFLAFGLEWVFAVLAVVTLVSAAAHYLSGAVHLAAPRRASAGVRTHLAVLCVAMAMVRAVAYWFDRYALVTSTRGYVRGLGHVDEHHVRPALGLLCLIALATAAFVMVGWHQRSWRLPMASASIWAITSLTANGVFPAVMQRMVADEPLLGRERPSIARNTSATRTALRLAAVSTSEAGATPLVASPADLVAASHTRLVPAEVVGLAAPGTASADLALVTVDGLDALAYLAVPTGAAAGKWSVRHQLDLTLAPPAVVPASHLSAGGVVRPVPNATRVVPGSGPILIGDEPLPYGVLVGADRPQTPKKLTSVDLSSLPRRMAFALRFGDADLVRRTTNDDQILYVRDVSDRVRKLAPFLAWDADPYAMVVGGRLVWAVDGYTTSDRYPSAERADVSALPERSGLRRSFNYVRSAVLALVDAHTGEVTLYALDATDPVLATWRAAFGGLFVPGGSLPREVAEQRRYPKDLLAVQAAMWGRYRNDDRPDDPMALADVATRWVTAPVSLDAAATPVTGASTTARDHSTTTQPGAPGALRATAPAYGFIDGLLTGVVPMVGARTPGLESHLAALARGTIVDGVARFGVVRVAADVTVASPATAAQRLQERIRAFETAGADLVFGDLQPVPIGGGIVWTLPWYAARSAQLRGVALLVGERVHLDATLEGALADAFRIDPGFTTVDGSPATASPEVPEDLSVDELLARARELEAKAARLRAAGADAEAFAALQRANDYLRRAAEAAVPLAPPPTTTLPTTTVPAGVTA